MSWHHCGYNLRCKYMFLERMSIIYCDAIKKDGHLLFSRVLMAWWDIYHTWPFIACNSSSVLHLCTWYHLRVCSSTCAAFFQHIIHYWTYVCHPLWDRVIQSIHIYYNNSESHHEQSSRILDPEMVYLTKLCWADLVHLSQIHKMTSRAVRIAYGLSSPLPLPSLALVP